MKGRRRELESGRFTRTRARRRGTSLAPVVVLLTIFTIISTTALRNILFDIKRVNMDYLELAARTTAVSGLELARRDLVYGDRLTSESTGEKIVLEYGDDVFPIIKNLNTACAVEVHLRGDRVFMESRVTMNRESGSGPAAVRRTVKALYEFAGTPPQWTLLWRVGD